LFEHGLEVKSDPIVSLIDEGGDGGLGRGARCADASEDGLDDVVAEDKERRDGAYPGRDNVITA
jgi:hypothetical protein